MPDEELTDSGLPSETEQHVTGDGQPPAPNPEKLFSQTDVNRIFGERLAREREKIRRDFLSELGAETLDDLKAKLDALRQTEEEQLSEKERLEQARDDFASKLAEAQSQLVLLGTTLRNERLHRLIELEAYRLNFADPADASKLLDIKGLDGEGDENSLPTQETIQKALKALAESKGYLLKSGPGLPSTNAGAGTGTGGATKEKADAEQALLDGGMRFIPPHLLPKRAQPS